MSLRVAVFVGFLAIACDSTGGHVPAETNGNPSSGGEEGGSPSPGGEEGGSSSPQQTEPSSPNACRRDLVPDAGDDACRVCALEHCCDEGTGKCISSTCFDGYFRRIRECFEREATARPSATSWTLLSGCHEELERDDPETHRPLSYDDSGSYSDEPGPWDLYCVLGLQPQPLNRGGEEDDGGLPGNFVQGDAPCAQECFPRWQ